MRAVWKHVEVDSEGQTRKFFELTDYPGNPTFSGAELYAILPDKKESDTVHSNIVVTSSTEAQPASEPVIIPMKTIKVTPSEKDKQPPAPKQSVRIVF